MFAGLNFFLIHTEQGVPPVIQLMPSLVWLSLAGNPIGVLDSDFFTHAKQLEYLDVSGCSLHCIESGFSLLSNLQELHLSENSQLLSLPKDLWRVSSLQHLYVRYTP